MDSRGKLLFDLNEPPAEADLEESDAVFSFQPQRTCPPTDSQSLDMFPASTGTRNMLTNHRFSHATTVSGFQPFIRHKAASVHDVGVDQKRAGDKIPKVDSLSKVGNGQAEASPVLIFSSTNHQAVDREEGEWSDAEGAADITESSSFQEQDKVSNEHSMSNRDVYGLVGQGVSCDGNKSSEPVKEEINSHTSLKSDSDIDGLKGNNMKNLEGNGRGDLSVDGQDEHNSNAKHVKATDPSYALRYASNSIKRKVDHQKEAMLGKKRNRQTMFLKLEDVKQAGPIKTSTPRRQNFPALATTRIIKDVQTTLPAERVGEKQIQPIVMDLKQDVSSDEGNTIINFSEPKVECTGDMNSGLLAKPRRLNGDANLSAEVSLLPVPRPSSWKQPTDSRQPKNSQLATRKPALTGQTNVDPKSGNKKHLSVKKQSVTSTSYQDSSVERLIREVTNKKFWHNPEDAELQRVPGSFESVEEYIRVFEPLLFEECRAQLYSNWEELTETFSRDTHVMVRLRSIERRERGWYDVIVIPANECKWAFKEGDVAILSSPKPGSVRAKRSNTPSVEDGEEPEISGRVAGTVRRYIPIDTRDPPGAVLHFYVGDSYDPNSTDDHILRKLHPKGIWFLTVLGSLATTQREYVALHAFRRLNAQMQNAILQPSPEHFPKYEQQPPAMPECFTQNFTDHLHKSFNGPQLGAIQWAAMHTAAGTSSGTTKNPWPFTLVQGPPGTGKTHTVWGMLNVIHLVQYQHYYAALLKKLAPESYKQNESSPENVPTGSIDELLQNMDQNLFRTLPKLCPKPRMLVCAPSNAATDELLARVLDRGFIDGEMKVYRPDVARVGVDSQTRAAQAVSVERRTEQLLMKSRDEVYGWMRHLRVREAEFAQLIARLQRTLTATAADVRSQGSVGVDPDVLMARDQNRDLMLQKLAEAVEGRDKVLVEMSRFLILESRFRPGGNFNMEEARANLEASFANEAEIVFTTVSSSGRKLFSRLTHGFDMVVIDEAAQASEVAILPPLSLGAARCVLVGDPQQLPATVISKAAGTLLYSRSLFERFQLAGCPTMLLSVQYRMHPQIRDFPSRYFYQARLTDSESITALPDEVYHKDPLLRPYVFFDITHGRESHRGGSVSYQNIHEAQFCFRLYEHLQRVVKSAGVRKQTVGIITPYKLQFKCLKREFEDVMNSEDGKDIYINTVDAFQGQERDVIIMSCVRASSHGVGFVADIRRMNVALTRARRSLWVMGNANALMQSEDWAALINDAKARNCYMDMEALPKEFNVPRAIAHNSGRPSGRGLR